MMHPICYCRSLAAQMGMRSTMLRVTLGMLAIFIRE